MNTTEPITLPTCDCHKYASQVCDICQVWRPTIDRITEDNARLNKELFEAIAAIQRWKDEADRLREALERITNLLTKGDNT